VWLTAKSSVNKLTLLLRLAVRLIQQLSVAGMLSLAKSSGNLGKHPVAQSLLTETCT